MLKNFDPNAAAASDSGIFGLPFSVDEARLVLVPVPWEVTTSYGGGTSEGPAAIFQASKQVDLFDVELGTFYEAGIAMLDANEQIEAWNALAKTSAQNIIQANGSTEDKQFVEDFMIVNQHSDALNREVYQTVKHLLEKNKLVGLVGGDHSTPFGAIQALLEQHPKMGVLHIDAHADMRNAFEGFEYSHASIMFNVMTKLPLTKLVQVGIRDFCEEEFEFIQQQPEKIKTFFDMALHEQKLQGKSWRAICDDIIRHLPKEVYISFDIDGLDPRFCPNTGTPVPGGLEFVEALYLFKAIIKSGRKIIGFDLNEVAPGKDNEWDANVGARILYKLCGWTIMSNANKN